MGGEIAVVLNFTGTNSMKAFVADSVTVFNAINNAEVLMPPQFEGTRPEFIFSEGASFELDMKDAIVFDPNAVEFELLLDNGLPPDNAQVYVDNGQLVIAIQGNGFGSA